MGIWQNFEVPNRRLIRQAVSPIRKAVVADRHNPYHLRYPFFKLFLTNFLKLKFSVFINLYIKKNFSTIPNFKLIL